MIDSKYIISQLKSFGSLCCHYSQNFDDHSLWSWALDNSEILSCSISFRLMCSFCRCRLSAIIYSPQIKLISFKITSESNEGLKRLGVVHNDTPFCKIWSKKIFCFGNKVANTTLGALVLITFGLFHSHLKCLRPYSLSLVSNKGMY